MEQELLINQSQLKVTVHTLGAVIERRFFVKLQNEGKTSLKIKGLPNFVDSVVITSPDENVNVQNVVIHKDVPIHRSELLIAGSQDTHAEVLASYQKLQRLQETLRECEAQKQNLTTRVEVLKEGLLKQSESQPNGGAINWDSKITSMVIESWNILEADAEKSLTTKFAAIEEREEETTAEITAVLAQLHTITRYANVHAPPPDYLSHDFESCLEMASKCGSDVTLMKVNVAAFDVERHGGIEQDVEVLIKYYDYNYCYWRPSYQMAFNSADNTLAVSFCATLSQQQGQDWENAIITFATTPLQDSKREMPSLQSKEARISHPESRGRSIQSPAMYFCSSLPMECAETCDVIRHPISDGSGIATRFVLQVPVDVKSQSIEQTIPIADFSLPATQHLRVWMPTTGSTVLSVLGSTNASSWMLLPSDSISIFIDGSPMQLNGRINAPVGLDEPFFICLGPEPLLSGSYLGPKSYDTASIVASWGKQRACEHKAVLRSGHTDSAVDVFVVWPVPEPTDKRITVSIENTTSEAHSDDLFLAQQMLERQSTEDDNVLNTSTSHVLSRVRIPRGKEETSITLRYTVSWSGDKRIRIHGE